MTDPTSTPGANRPLSRLAGTWLPAAILVAAILVAYLRVWHAGFIWDDDDHLTRNPCIVGPLGFSAIWTSSRAVYYPLVLTTFWIEHAIWGLNPLPYHVVNVLMHASCAILLWRVLLRLNVAGAWLGAVLWALHPVQVESVAWVTEMKNTQSGLFYLLAILFFLRWLEKPGAAGTSAQRFAWRYGLALLFAVLAILSKSSTVMLPVILGLCWWWMDRKWRWLNLAWLAPFALVSAAASAWTVWEQKYANHALGAEWSQSWPERVVIAGKDVWFYLWKLACPHPLIFIYPRWSTNATDASAFIPFIAVASLLILLWLARDGIARPVFFASAYFVVSLFPVLSFFNVYFFRYSFVGDHFQYLASMGPLALAGAAIAYAARLAGGERGLLYPVASGALIVVLCMLTWLQCAGFENLETLWRSTLANNNDAWIAHFNLADILRRQGHLNEAILHYQEELRLVPDSTEARGNMALILMMQGHLDDAIGELEELLRIDPKSPEGHLNLCRALLMQGRADEAIPQGQEAVELAQQPDKSGEPHNEVLMLRILAAAYAKAGRYTEATKTARTALQQAQSQSNTDLAGPLRRELQLYQASVQATPDSR